MKKNSHIKKGKLALLALAGAAFVASLVYDNKCKEEGKINSETPIDENKTINDDDVIIEDYNNIEK